MGGQNTEINDRTVDVLIESAYFKPPNIRRTSKALVLRTRILLSLRARRGHWHYRLGEPACAQLILETAGGQLAAGVVDAYPRRTESSHRNTCAFTRPTSCLGSRSPAKSK